MSSNTPEPTRERILDGAERCFYRQGITASGVDAVAEAAGVSKRTLYNHFDGKDAVVTAYLERREQQWRDRLAEALSRAEAPIDRVMAYVRSYYAQDDLEGYRGCAFINAAAELADDSHPAMAVIRGSVAHVEDGLGEILATAGVDDHREVARQILIVLEGSTSVSGIRRNGDAYDSAERLVRTLVERALDEVLSLAGAASHR